MKFKDLLTEKFKTAEYMNKDFVEIFEDPTKKEQMAILRSMKGVRNLYVPVQEYGGNSMVAIRFGITDTKNPKLYAWRGDQIHTHVLAKFRDLKFNAGLTYLPSEKEIQIDLMYTQGIQKG